MIIDERTEFCSGTALNTGAAGSYLIGDVLDIEDLRDIGNNGMPLYLVILVSTSATSAGAATGTFKLMSDAQAAIDPATGTTHLASPTFAVANMTAGTEILKAVIPLEGNVYERYVGIVQTTGVAAFTGGAVSAFLTLNPSAMKYYPDGQN